MEQLSVGGRQSFTPKRCSFRSSSSSDRHGFDFRCTHLTYFYGLATKAHASLEEFDFDRLPRRSAAFCDTLAGISHTQATPEYLGNFLKAVLSLANDRYAAARAEPTSRNNGRMPCTSYAELVVGGIASHQRLSYLWNQ